MTMFVKVLILIALVLWGGTCIGSALACYKDTKYGGCGMGVSFAIVSYAIMFKVLTLIWG